MLRLDGGGWLQDGFLEGMRVRMTFGNTSVIVKIASIFGDNATRDSGMTFTNEGTAPTFNSDQQTFSITRVAAVAGFSANNWFVAQTIVMRADPFYTLPEVTDEVLVSFAHGHVLSNLKAAVEFEGGALNADRSLNAAAKLPGETDAFLIPVGPQPPESRAVDVLNLFADGSLQNLDGKAESTNVRGFGLPPGVDFGLAAPIFGETGVFAEGINYNQLSFSGGVRVASADRTTIEVVNLLLGQGDDVMDIVGTMNNQSAITVTSEFVFSPGGTGGTISRAGLDFAAAGFLPGQTVSIAGITGTWTVAAINDATGDSNDNSILALTGGATALPVLSGAQTLTAQDALIQFDVLVLVGVAVLLLEVQGVGRRRDDEVGRPFGHAAEQFERVAQHGGPVGGRVEGLGPHQLGDGQGLGGGEEVAVATHVRYSTTP
ncbi:hypothetical protein J4558_27180 [Leptolyngbya sp. 15MV]|nr:hypothetical protein J4558_27180 [Leptolyngbya sp. 15MV]